MGATLAVAVLSIGLYGYWVGSAPSDAYTSADAVVVHAGQRHRLRRALQLMDDGAAPVLVLLFPVESYGRDSDDLCQGQHDFEVICTDPERDDTVGEAIEIGRLAEEYRWRSAVIVTSDYHLRRAALLDRSCSDIAIYGDGARSRDLPARFHGVIKEMAALPIDALGGC
jgi:uncharacterized SAM-binding protein YcdF (DUF218 family)